jgi:hypothetical protein
MNADGGTPIGDRDSLGANGIASAGIEPDTGGMDLCDAGIGDGGIGDAGIGGAPGPKGAGTAVVADIAAPVVGGIAATVRPALPGAWASVGPIGPGRTAAAPAAVCAAWCPPGPAPVGPPPGIAGPFGPPPRWGPP